MDGLKKTKTKNAPSDLSRNYSPDSDIFTPPSIVNYIIKLIHRVIKQKFSIENGILSNNITFFEPSAGMMAFPLGLLNFARENYGMSKNKELKKWLESVFIPKTFMYEIDEQYFKMGNQKLKKIIQQLTSFNISDISLNHFNTNTLLENNNSKQKLLKLTSKQSILKIRDNIPFNKEDILIIFGNPPYSISSSQASQNTWIRHLIEDYKKELQPPNRKKISGLKGIQDEYIKFIRFSQWKLSDQNHKGILGFVVNNYFLDGMVFRGMRASLCKNFDEIYITNLYGDPKKKIHLDNDEEDENIFGIQTGICILLLIKYTKNEKRNKNRLAKIFYAECYGTLENKKKYLEQSFSANLNDFKQVKNRIDYQFIPVSEDYLQKEREYFSFNYLPQIFEKHIIGAQSLHDTLVTHPDKKRLENIVKNFYENNNEDYKIIDKKGQKWIKAPDVVYHDARDWKIKEAKQGNVKKALNNITLCQRKGFDKWWMAYDEHLMTKGSSSFKMLQFMFSFQENFAIGCARVSRKASGENSVLATNTIADSHFIEGGSGIGDYLFPLKYNPKAYDKSTNNDWRNPLPTTHFNFKITFINKLRNKYGLEIIKSTKIKSQQGIININLFDNQKEMFFKDIFSYIYGLLWTPNFRMGYKQFLKDDFPRIFFPKSYDDFKSISKLGNVLLNLHTMNFERISGDLKELNINYNPKLQISSLGLKTPIKIINPTYDKKTKTLSLNANQLIHNTPVYVWEFEIGGIMQLKSWLRYREYKIPSNIKKYSFHRGINQEELEFFFNMINAIKTTKNIENLLEKHYFQTFVNKEKDYITFNE